eukprot:TRINITY_DN9480_c0_g1_i4.p1 TRINITY_DN9480_c0_g1~~TRINITY_DN9480_c0_g1_i4.p1  ORF type:complete len:176 (-),score=19.00 TRINITY_DN9480_c0_g1_i4:38-565(-)
MADSDSAGFRDAPVVKAIFASVTVASLVNVISTYEGVELCRLLKSSLSWDVNMYRIITVHIAFSSVTELLLGLSLLYFFRVFERQMGSGKYGFFVFFVTLLSTIMYVTKLFGSTSLESIIPGPYPIIFSSFVLYLVDIIPRHFITVFRWTVPDKSLVYLGALQVVMFINFGLILF